EKLKLNIVEFDFLSSICLREVSYWSFDLSDSKEFKTDLIYFSDKLYDHRKILKRLMDYNTLDFYSFIFERVVPKRLEEILFSFWTPGSKDIYCIEILSFFESIINLDSLLESKILEKIKER